MFATKKALLVNHNKSNPKETEQEALDSSQTKLSVSDEAEQIFAIIDSELLLSYETKQLEGQSLHRINANYKDARGLTSGGVTFSGWDMLILIALIVDCFILATRESWTAGIISLTTCVVLAIALNKRIKENRARYIEAEKAIPECERKLSKFVQTFKNLDPSLETMGLPLNQHSFASKVAVPPALIEQAVIVLNAKETLTLACRSEILRVERVEYVLRFYRQCDDAYLKMRKAAIDFGVEILSNKDTFAKAAEKLPPTGASTPSAE